MSKPLIHERFNRFNGMKILAYSDTLRRVANGVESFPLDWHIYPSNICNHKCVWCMFRQETPSGQPAEQLGFAVKLGRSILRRAVQDAYRTGAVQIEFSGGGEPLLNRYTVETIEYAQAMNAQLRPWVPEDRAGRMAITLTTNGRKLEGDAAKSIMRNCDSVRVSLNAGNAAMHWQTNHGGDTRDPGDWDIILENLRAAVNVEGRRADLGCGFVVDQNNWHTIYEFCQIAAEIGVDFVQVRPAFFYDAEMNSQVRAIMPDALAECDRARTMFGEQLQVFAITKAFDNYWTPRTYSRCTAIKSGIVLRATGDFAVCQDRTDLTFGTDPSYVEGASFEEVWRSAQRRKVVDSVCEGGEIDRCPRCVWNGRNEIIENVFIDDKMRLALV